MTVAEAILDQGPLQPGISSAKAPTLRLNTGYQTTREERSGATVEVTLLDEDNDDAVLATFRTEADIQPPDLWWWMQGASGAFQALLGGTEQERRAGSPDRWRFRTSPTWGGRQPHRDCSASRVPLRR